MGGLCFEGMAGKLVYLGRPGLDFPNRMVEIRAVVPDIATDPHLALSLLREETGLAIPPAIPLPPPGGKEGHSLSVLLADDDPMTRALMEGFLARRVRTLTVENPRKASANFAVLNPDVVFLDLHYRDEIHDGFDVLGNILSINRDAYIVIMSGDRDAATIYASLKKGARGFIAKPLRAEDFYRHLSAEAA